MTDIKHVVVYGEPGRFGGWPANNGVWSWGNEILVGFARGYYKENEKSHSIDREKPSEKAMARSLDGGESWNIEIPEGLNSGMEPIPCPGGINFDHPGFAMRCGGARFYISYDLGNSWKIRYNMPETGEDLTSRTDYIVNSQHDCLFFLSATREGGREKALCARTTDGGKTFDFTSWMTDDPLHIRSVMPSTVRCSESQLISALRRRQENVCWLDVYVSNDNGRNWEFLSKIADIEGKNGNPPSMARLEDGRLCVTYGYRSVPYGIRAKISSDNGKTWGEEIHLRDDGRTWDLGYTRTVQRPDGKLVTIYYNTTSESPEQHIVATIWDPDLFR